METDKQHPDRGSDFIQLSCFYLQDTFCGLDINIVQEINEDLQITKVPLSQDYVIGIMNLRGQIVTVVDQSRKIGFEPSVISEDSRVIIVNSQNEHIGLLVDRVTEVLTISTKDIADAPSNIEGAQGKFFKGVVHTAKNEILALLDVEAVLTEDHGNDK
ncbi:MAG: chemotaxis protein CheW [Desulfobulbaceae bacterium]|nr:chemotaxis protein CheW [Desulfobulbaceae bacterium]